MSVAVTEPSATDLADRAIQHRYEFVLLFDVKNGNPNGDPDAGNAPRIDPETGHGLVSDVCLKRKIRNYVTLVKRTPEGTPEPGYDIYVKEKAVLNAQHLRGYEALGLDPKVRAKPKEGESPAEERVRRWMCQTFFDIRMFGAVMSTDVNAGQVRGPVQVAFARSIQPIVSLEQSITRMAVTTEAEKQKQEQKQAGQARMMGRKEIIPYALYRAHGFISPHFAADTGFSNDDLDLLFRALEEMFDHDHSAARGEMGTCRLFVFEHESKLGNAPARKLFDLIHVEPKAPEQPARQFSDYEVIVDRDSVPSGVTLHERL
ncbi:MAG: type I-C CRISPR-associated protein Cas7/Csd2 [Planctomycetaceae bacterium]|nr:type I-C CRISPR-associated protein Cas7/Csd2 [Planctomycetaceae bacterium]